MRSGLGAPRSPPTSAGHLGSLPRPVCEGGALPGTGLAGNKDEQPALVGPARSRTGVLGCANPWACTAASPKSTGTFLISDSGVRPAAARGGLRGNRQPPLIPAGILWQRAHGGCRRLGRGQARSRAAAPGQAAPAGPGGQDSAPLAERASGPVSPPAGRAAAHPATQASVSPPLHSRSDLVALRRTEDGRW